MNDYHLLLVIIILNKYYSGYRGNISPISTLYLFRSRMKKQLYFKKTKPPVKITRSVILKLIRSLKNILTAKIISKDNIATSVLVFRTLFEVR